MITIIFMISCMIWISTKSAIRHFIFTLGPEFETIQNNCHIDNLPMTWKTQDWPLILTLCQDYYNVVKSQGSQKKIKQWLDCKGTIEIP